MLPRRINQQMVFQFSQGAGPMPMPMPMPMLQAPESTGFTLDKTDESGRPVKALSMFGNSVIYSSASYGRWDDVWPEADRVFGEILPVVLTSGNLVTTTTLEYVNHFIWSDAPFSADVSSLLLQGPFVCPNVFRATGLWHSFHGFFRDADEPMPGRHLENINLTLSDRPDPSGETEDPRRCLDIVVNHRFILSPSASSVPDQPPVHLGPHVTAMHKRNKAILRELLQVSIVNQIPGLGVP